ncbi:MAG TPA: ankyrin repeat domain-containing protein [Candidimonas sp.]|nr:ankyrin repeat domain-containing protein [Candidimonas sp.]
MTSTLQLNFGRVLAGCLLVFSGALSYAANPSDWWIHIANDRAEPVKSLLVRGADPNELSPKGQPALMQAIRDEAWDVYDVLVTHPKTALNAININRETPLMYLAVLGQTKRAQDLIKRGAQVNRLGWTPLQYAASTGQIETAKMLLAHQAIVNAPGPDGTTALMMAAHSGSVGMVQLLLDHGADVTTRNLQKLDAADWAREKKHTALAAQLDALIQKTLKERATGGAATRATLTPDNGKAKQQAPRQTNNDAAPEKPSTSKYFDLERFNDKPQP